MHLLKLFSPMDPLALEAEAERSRKLKLIKRALAEHTVLLYSSQIDIKLVRQLSRTPHGLVNDEIRKLVWPMLLNLQREAIFTTFGSYSRDQKKQILAENPFYTLDPQQTWKSNISPYHVRNSKGEEQLLRTDSQGYRPLYVLIRRGGKHLPSAARSAAGTAEPDNPRRAELFVRRVQLLPSERG